MHIQSPVLGTPFLAGVMDTHANNPKLYPNKGFKNTCNALWFLNRTRDLCMVDQHGKLSVTEAVKYLFRFCTYCSWGSWSNLCAKTHSFLLELLISSMIVANICLKSWMYCACGACLLSIFAYLTTFILTILKHVVKWFRGRLR